MLQSQFWDYISPSIQSWPVDPINGCTSCHPTWSTWTHSADAIRSAATDPGAMRSNGGTLLTMARVSRAWSTSTTLELVRAPRTRTTPSVETPSAVRSCRSSSPSASSPMAPTKLAGTPRRAQARQRLRRVHLLHEQSARRQFVRLASGSGELARSCRESRHRQIRQVWRIRRPSSLTRLPSSFIR